MSRTPAIERLSRTRAALGLAGRGYFAWQLRGIREVPGMAEIRQVWQGPTAFPRLPTVGAGLTVVSDAATDTGGGTGARSVAVIYLNSALEIRLGLANLAGVVVVDVLEFDQVTQTTGTSVLDALRVVAVNVTDVGLTGNNDGELLIKIAADIQAVIPRIAAIVSLGLLNSARPGGFTVPAGFCAVLDTFNNDLVSNVAKVAVQAKPPRQPWQGIMGGGQLADVHEADPITFPAGTDIRLALETSAPGVAPGLYAQPEVNLYLHPEDETKDTDPAQIPQLFRCGFGV